MTDFETVVAATPWRTHLLIATVDGVRLWELSDGDVEWQLPPHFTDDDLQRLRAWADANLAARRSGGTPPLYRDFMRPDAPRVPITADEMAYLAGFPPDGVNLQHLIDEAEGELDDEEVTGDGVDESR